MQGQLDDITNALGAIHEDVKAMRQEISRLTGKPVLEVMKAYRQSVLKRYLCMLPADVYIEPHAHQCMFMVLEMLEVASKSCCVADKGHRHSADR